MVSIHPEDGTGAPRPSSLWRVFASLKLRLLRNGLRASKRTRFGTIAMAIASIVGGAVAANSFISDSAEGPLAWSRSLIPGFAVIFLAWVFGPLLLGGVDDTLDPRRLAVLPLTNREITSGLSIGAFLAFLPLGTVIALTGVVIAHGGPGLRFVLVIAACITELVLVFGASRFLSVVLAWTSRSRRGRDIGILLASVTAGVLWLATQSLAALNDDAVDEVNRWLAWTPPGALGHAVLDARNGAHLAAAVRIGVVAALAVGSIVAWSRLLAAYLVVPPSIRRTERTASSISANEGRLAGVVRRIGGPLAGAVFIKEMRYLARSPGRRSAMAVSMVMGVPFVILQVLRSGGFRPGIAIYAPAALIFGLGSVNNLLGADGPSLWLEVTSGASLKELLVGRGVAAIPFVVLPVTLTTVVLAVLGRSLEHVFPVLCVVWLGWGIPLGIGAYTSVAAPFSQADDANPFSNSSGSTGSGMLVMFVAMLSIFATALSALPLIVGFVATSSLGSVQLLIMAPVCAAYSYAFWRVGLYLAVRRSSRTGMDLLGLLTPRGALQS